VEPTNNVSYVYDDSGTSPTKGLLLSISMTGPLPTYQETFSYDSFKRVWSRTWTRDGRSYTIGYQYNSAGQRTQITYPSGRVVTFGRDNKGRLTSIGNFLTSVSYNGIGQMTGLSLGNGVTESFGYDPQRMQLVSQTAKGSDELLSLNYNYQAQAGQMGPGTTAGNAGQLMSVSGSINGMTESASYRYDLWGRLVTSNQTTNGVTAQRRFAYDRWGNRTGMWDAVSGGNQIQSITLQQSAGAPTNRVSTVNTVSYSYDSSGNVVSDGLHSYGYDAENRMTSADSGSTGSYRYDYQNRRVQKVTTGAPVHYIWEGSQVIAEYNVSTGALLAEYISSGRGMLAKVENGVTSYFVSDRLSTRLVLDSTGNVLSRQSHLPYGEEIASAGSVDKRRFTSYERDDNINSDYAVHRQYALSTGRFQQPDPYRTSGYLVDPQSWNRYSYVRGDPVNRLDPTGLLDRPLNVWIGVAPHDTVTVTAPTEPLSPTGSQIAAGLSSGDIANSAFITDNTDAASPNPELEAPQAGRLEVDPNCEDVLYAPEGNKAPKTRPGDAWKSAPADGRVEADFVATPRGVIKIPDGCYCSVDCGNGKNYEVFCTCLFTPAYLLTDAQLDAADDVADPRKVGRWVVTKERYRENTLAHPEAGFTTSFR
jgi:RHS repeat-associated protein